MNRKIFFLFASLLLCATLSAQEKSDLHKRAEAADPKEHIATARSLYIHAFNGLAQVLIQSSHHASPLCLKVSADGMSTGSIVVESK